MKQIVAIVLFSICIHRSYAQFAENNSIYSTCEINLGNYVGVDVNLNYIYKEKYSIKVGFIGNIRTPVSRPADFSGGLMKLFTYGTSNPYDHLENLQICFGKIYTLNNNNTIRANISIGIGYTTIREPNNWVKLNDNFLTANYDWSYSSLNTISLIINPKIEFPFTRVYGLSISPMLQINKYRTYYGIGIGHMIGLLRKREN